MIPIVIILDNLLMVRMNPMDEWYYTPFLELNKCYKVQLKMEKKDNETAELALTANGKILSRSERPLMEWENVDVYQSALPNAYYDSFNMHSLGNMSVVKNIKHKNQKC